MEMSKAIELVRGFAYNQVEITKAVNFRRKGPSQRLLKDERRLASLLIEALAGLKPTDEQVKESLVE